MAAFGRSGSGGVRHWWPLAVWLGLVALVTGWLMTNAVAERDKALHDAELRVQLLCQLGAMHVHNLFEGADTALIATAIMIGRAPDWDALAADRGLWEAIHEMGASMSAVPRLVVVDPSGTIRVHGDAFPVKPASIADRKYFQDHRAQASDRSIVGVPVMGRVSNVPSLTISRRLSLADGAFAGVVVANLHPQVFSQFFNSLVGADEGGILSLQRDDGTLLVRHPVLEDAMGTKVDNARAFPAIAQGRPDGVAVTVSPLDGMRRITAFKRLDRFGLVMLAGLPVEQVLAPWWQQTRRMTMVVGFGLMVLTGFLVLLLQRRRSEVEIQQRLKASEENLRQAQATAKLGYYVYDMATDRWTSSDILDGIFGIGADYSRSGAGWLDLVVPSMRAEMAAYLDEIQAGEHGFDREYQIIRVADGQVRWVAGLGQVERDKAGRPFRMVGTIQDITERKQDHQALREKAEELIRSNTELEQFAYVASHDLREPLRMVSSYVDLLGRRYADKLDEDAREFIAFAKDGANRMDHLVLDLLEYSRIGRVTQPMAAVPLDKVLDRAVRALQAKIIETGARVNVEAASLPTVMGDSDELVRLFQNLIGNAVKYRAADQPPVVTVTAQRLGPYWEISVSDNGIGIDPQYFERIFLIFQRLHKRGEYEGTGIGLAICKKIAERHGGRIWLESTPGEGSVFRVTLPVVEA